ncbi:MAG TPA: GNAT family N-acetyltransferase [Actinomycetota bacterium]|nr:GNAT family N-acetyltransferase [Actinomycetota bacterium]
MSDGFLLETDRLRLRPLAEHDLDALHAVLGDPELMRYYPAPFSLADTGEWIDKQLARYTRDGFGLWAMELEETGEMIGDCGLTIQDVDGVGHVEVGWHVRRDMCNQGFATEAAKACRDFAFGEMGLTRLISLVRPENLASCRVAEKLGMTVFGHTVRGPGWDHRIYELEVSSAFRTS